MRGDQRRGPVLFNTARLSADERELWSEEFRCSPVTGNEQRQTQSGGNLSDVHVGHDPHDTGGDNTGSHVDCDGDQTDTKGHVELLA